MSTEEMDRFEDNELELEAEVDNLPKLVDFIEYHLLKANASHRARIQICVAAEEIFVNIASYAYAPEVGKASVRVEVLEDPVQVTITFMDGGKPFDPLERKDPDVTLPAEKRGIGGLGIFMTKKTMDEVSYAYKDGRNILQLKKSLQ